MKPSSRLRVSLAAIAATIVTIALAAAPQDRPAFRAAVDIIEVDVRVVDGTGAPISGLTADKFDVSIDGKKRRVVSAELVKYGRPASTAGAAAESSQPAGPPPVWLSPNRSIAASSQGRLFVLHVDTDSFDVVSSRNIMATAGSFMDRLQATDRVGLAVFPVGSLVDPTTDHAAVKNALAKVVGMPSTLIAAQVGEFGLRPSEVELLTYHRTRLQAGGNPVKQAEILIDAICGTDADCRTRRLPNEVQGLVQDYENQATQGLFNIKAVLQQLAPIAGRKTLVVISGGVPTTNRPGGRPSIGNLDLMVGQDAQRSNTAIYALYVDWNAGRSASAEQRRAPRTMTSLTDDSALFSRSLDVFAGASGGTFLKVLSGRGETAFDQILRETSAYYLLGVEPAESDRDGKARQLSVKVTQRSATVHGSRWVTVPRRQ